jgi:catechol 2,3-dioxygenase-like lactoylglutathione lyase family enzyme
VELYGRQPELLRYYRDALGLPIRDARDDWGLMELGGANGAGLVPGQAGAPYAPNTKPGSVALVFEVDDFDDAIAELRARGVSFSCESDERTGLRTARMRAPDGLMHTLVEPAPAAAGR